jgi:hypothetical protein
MTSRVAHVAFALGLIVLAVAYLVLSVDLGVHTPVGWDLEEMHNATAAREVSVGQFASLPHFQATDFCGGCTAVSAVGGLYFSLAGTTWWAWKAVPITFGVLILLLGALLVRRASSPTAGLLFAALFAAAPPLLGQASLYGRGNHFEVLPLVLACGLTGVGVCEEQRRSRWFVLGALTMLAGWFCLTGLPLVLAVCGLVFVRVGFEAVRRGAPSMALGIAAGALPMLWFGLATGRDPIRYFLSSNVSTSWDLTHAAQRFVMALWWGAASLVNSDVENVATGPGFAWAAVLTIGWLGVCLRRKDVSTPGSKNATAVVVVLWLAALVSYVFAPVPRSMAGPMAGMPGPHAVRYLVVPWILGLAVGAVGLELVGRRWGRVLPILALVVAVGVGLSGRWDWHQTRTSQWAQQAQALPFDYTTWVCDPGGEDWWPETGFCHIPEATLRGWGARDRISQVNAARWLGCQQVTEFRAAEDGDFPAWLRSLESSEDDPTALLQGLGQCLGRQLTSEHHHHVGTNADAFDRLMRSMQLLEPANADALAVGAWTAPGSWETLPPEDVEGCRLCPKRWTSLPAAGSDGDSLRAVFGDAVDGLPTSSSGRMDAMIGLGFSYGRHSPSVPSELLSRLPADAAAQFKRGARIGAAARWRSDLVDSHGVEAVP